MEYPADLSVFRLIHDMGLSHRQCIALLMIREAQMNGTPLVTVAQLATAIGRHVQTAEKVLGELYALGLVRRVLSKRPSPLIVTDLVLIPQMVAVA